MTSSPSKPSVAIIGAGPSGLMAAFVLAKAGAQVTVYDQMPTAGRKFLMAGRGGLNLTHSEPHEAFVARYGDAASWVRPALEGFSPEDLCRWSEELGQKTFIGTSGRVFPEALKASPLLRRLLTQLAEQGVVFSFRHRWTGWTSMGDLAFDTSHGAYVVPKPDATLLALGGASWPRLGSDGAWTDLLSRKGIQTQPLVSANCGFEVAWTDIFKGRFAGTPLKPLRLSVGAAHVQGEAMITERGIEGGAIYALSSQLRQKIEREGQAILSVDLRPAMSIDDLLHRLKAPRGSQTTTSYLRKVLALSPVAIGLMRESLKSQNLPDDPVDMAQLVKNASIILLNTSPIDRAISSAGGVCHSEIDENLMLRKIPGTFVAGEMLDWEAPTGGYLLQACFSLAVMAARGIKNYLVF